MKLTLIFLLLSGLFLPSHYLYQTEEGKENNVEVLQEVQREENFGTYRDNSEESQDKSQKEYRAISIPSGEGRDNQTQAIGIPAGESGSIDWLNYFFLSLPLFAFVGWLVFKIKFETISTAEATKIHELQKGNFAKDSRGVALTGKGKDNEEVKQISRIREFMVAEQPYLDPELTIKTMADQLDMEVRELSLLINTYFKQNFYDFLNQYRIEKAKELLKDPQNKKLTILEILFSVGFNSKSSFNTSFKKLSGLTPTEYRQVYSR